MISRNFQVKVPLFAIYVALIVITFFSYHLISYAGGLMFSAGREAAVNYSPSTLLLDTLVALAVIIVFGKFLGFLFRLASQPPVIGEIIAGLLLGPSLIASAFPHFSQILFSPSTLPTLSVISQLGIILYMFQIGLEFNEYHIRGNVKSIAIISHVSIAVPFLLGAGLSLWLYPRYASPEINFTHFSLFIGVAISVTAFPVLARILSDYGLSSTKLGTIALSCAAIDDVTAWLLLGVIICLIQSDIQATFLALALTFAFFAFMLLIVRPALRKFSDTAFSPAIVVFIMVMVLLCAISTEAIGLHAIFGAFLLGVVIPHDSLWSREIAVRLKDIVRILLLPAFFVVTGLRTDLRILSGSEEWLAFLLILSISILGKMGSAFFASRRVSDLSFRESLALGALMNTRGLVELIILNIGLELGIISQAVFSMLVLMAVITTLMTGPLIRLFLPDLFDCAHRDFRMVAP